MYYFQELAALTGVTAYWDLDVESDVETDKKFIGRTNFQKWFNHFFYIMDKYRRSNNYINIGKDFYLKGNQKESLKNLPPTFIAASHSDQDVPVSISQEMSKLIPNTQTFLTENLPHDFDANLQLDVGKTCYQEVIYWLDSFNKKDQK